MTEPVTSQFTNPSTASATAVAAMLAMPIAMPPAFGYETNPAFLLAPFVAGAVVLSWREWTARLFVLAGLGGLVSITIAAYFYPDGRLTRNTLGLVLIMYSAGFYFLGRRMNRDSMLRWLAILSTLFVVLAAGRLIVTGQYVRWFLPPDGLAYLNVEVFGLPVFATFGVNALAHLICIQSALICGLAFDRGSMPWQAPVGIAGFAASAFLIVGSDSRSSQAFLMALLAALLLYILRHRIAWKIGASLLAAALLAGTLGALYAPSFRLGATAIALVEAASSGSKAGDQAGPAARAEAEAAVGTNELPIKSMDSLSTGRVALMQTGVREIISSPWIGSGFSPFGRYTEGQAQLFGNSSTHVYYLTLLWKGGLIFALPFFAYLGIAAANMLRRKAWGETPEGAFATVAVILTFVFLALTYDTPAVPSAGALAFLLLGTLSKDKATT